MPMYYIENMQNNGTKPLNSLTSWCAEYVEIGLTTYHRTLAFCHRHVLQNRAPLKWAQHFIQWCVKIALFILSNNGAQLNQPRLAELERVRRRCAPHHSQARTRRRGLTNNETRRLDATVCCDDSWANRIRLACSRKHLFAQRNHARMYPVRLCTLFVGCGGCLFDVECARVRGHGFLSGLWGRCQHIVLSSTQRHRHMRHHRTWQVTCVVARILYNSTLW